MSWYLSFSVWLTSLSMIISRSIIPLPLSWVSLKGENNWKRQPFLSAGGRFVLSHLGSLCVALRGFFYVLIFKMQKVYVFITRWTGAGKKLFSRREVEEDLSWKQGRSLEDLKCDEAASEVSSGLGGRWPLSLRVSVWFVTPCLLRKDTCLPNLVWTKEPSKTTWTYLGSISFLPDLVHRDLRDACCHQRARKSTKKSFFFLIN